MLHEHLLIVLSLLFAVSLLIMLGQKLRISYPIFLVIGGLLISFVPGMPRIEVNPELVFLIFLPPLLYEAAWYTSWYDFWRWKRAIGLLGFGLVIFTSGIIAVVSSSMIPGFTLAMGFLLGGIISPPDAVAATSVLKNLNVPKRALVVLEGESLVNDAASLIVFRFALAAVLSGTFVFQEAATDFIMVTLMGIVTGLVVAHIFYVIHRYLPTNASIDAALTLMTPYFMYIAAEHFHFSGVMSVVTGGLFLSFRSHEILSSEGRIQAYGVWTTLTFLLNGLVFILIGLQLPFIVEGLGNYSLSEAIGYALIISLITIVTRIAWVFPAAYLPRLFSKKIRTREANPGWRNVFLVAWAGMRGVVSLASALSIPVMMSNGEQFPHRNLILFITFVVILVTLVFQGLSLPFVIRKLGIKENENMVPEEEQEAGARLRLMQVAARVLQEKYSHTLGENDLVDNLHKQLTSDIQLTSQRLESLECDTCSRAEVETYNNLYLDLIGEQRRELFVIKKENIFDSEILRRLENHLDLEEARLRE